MAKVPFVGHILSAPPLLNLIMIHLTFIHSGGGIKMNLRLTFLTLSWFLYGWVVAERGVSHNIVKSFLLKSSMFLLNCTVGLCISLSCFGLVWLFDLANSLSYMPTHPADPCAKMCKVCREPQTGCQTARQEARRKEQQLPSSRLCIRLLDTSCLACKQSKDATHAKSSCRWLLSFPSKLPAPDSNQAVLEARRSLETKGTYRAPTR